MLDSHFCLLNCIQVFQETGKVVCIPTSLRIFHPKIGKVIIAFAHKYVYGWASQMALVVKNPPANADVRGFNPWVGEIPWRRKWQLVLVLLPGKSHGQRTLADYSPWGLKRVRHDFSTKQQQRIIYKKKQINQDLF